MTSTTPGAETHEDPDSAAAAWFAHLQGDDVLPEDRRAFERWLNLDDRHVQAWQSVSTIWNGLTLIETDPTFAAMRADALGAGPVASRPVNRRAVGALAAAGVIAAAGGLFFGRRLLATKAPMAPQAAQDPVFTTAVGEQSTFHLVDNSVVTLSTDSAVRVNVWKTERRLTLLRGQAFFQVAKDPSRPFVVAAGDKSVTAVGTAFDVRMEPGKLSVTLVEGRVRIAGPSPSGDRTIEMSAGSQFVANNAAAWVVAAVDTAKESSWLQGRLVFDGEPLSSVVDEMNRFSQRKLWIADPRVGATPVSGVFKTGQVDAFVAALRTYGLAEVGRADDKQVELIRPRG